MEPAWGFIIHQQVHENAVFTKDPLFTEHEYRTLVVKSWERCAECGQGERGWVW